MLISLFLFSYLFLNTQTKIASHNEEYVSINSLVPMTQVTHFSNSTDLDVRFRESTRDSAQLVTASNGFCAGGTFSYVTLEESGLGYTANNMYEG